MMAEDTDVYWEPPSDAEMKVIQAKRERTDKISALMGEYLLKGYKMLSSICDVCETILLQDRQGQLYCIACSEVDPVEHAKDDPALSATAARRQVEESQYSQEADELLQPAALSNQEIAPRVTSTTNPSENPLAFVKPTNAPHVLHPVSVGSFHSSNVLVSQENASYSHLLLPRNAIKEKMIWASQEIQRSQDMDYSIKLCTLLKTCAETLILLKRAQDIDGSGDQNPL